MNATTSKRVRLLTRCLYDGLLFVDNEVDAREYRSEDGARRVELLMPADDEYETESQYGFISIAIHEDGRLEIVLEGLVRSGRQVRLEATAPSFTIKEKKVNPADFPGH